MAGTLEGGRKAAQTNKQRYGNEFYVTIGAAGGEKSRGGGFAKDHDLAVSAGRKGGQATRVYHEQRKAKQVVLEKIERREKKSWLARVFGE